MEDKQNTIPGKSLSSNDFTDYYRNKLKGIEEEAEVNVQADWDENDETADSYIKNKPESLPASDVPDWAKEDTKPSYKLHILGSVGATAYNNTSDLRLKDVQYDWAPSVDDIADAPSFAFKWKNDEDLSVHVGTSALYWKEKAPELVSQADDEIGTLSILYDVLGALNSISLANEILQLKKEIKQLQALIAELKLLQNN